MAELAIEPLDGLIGFEKMAWIYEGWEKLGQWVLPEDTGRYVCNTQGGISFADIKGW